MARLVDRYVAPLRHDRERHLVKINTPIETRISESQTKETNMGNFLADVIRDALGTDVGFINAGSIRGDKIFFDKLTYGYCQKF